MDEFKKYRRKQQITSELRPFVPGEVLDPKISISATDKEKGSPKQGDWIARNPLNHDDQWLIAAQFFNENLDPDPVE